MIYLASPYSHTNPEVVLERFQEAEIATATLLKNGEKVWSPIVHCHALACAYQMPTDAQFWKSYNEDFIRRADEVLVLQIQGWDASKGVKMEIEFANFVGIPLNYITPRNGYVRSPTPWIFTKHEEIMKSDRELIEAALEKDRMSLTLNDCKLNDYEGRN
jgi:hypothetical protein